MIPPSFLVPFDFDRERVTEAFSEVMAQHAAKDFKFDPYVIQGSHEVCHPLIQGFSVAEDIFCCIDRFQRIANLRFGESGSL